MTDEKHRFYNPVTLIIEYAPLAYAASVGLIPWDGEVEIDKAMVERAVLGSDESITQRADVTADLDLLDKPGLIERATDLGLSTDGTKAEISARIIEFAETVAEDAAAADEQLHSDPAGGEESITDSPREGQE